MVGKHVKELEEKLGRKINSGDISALLSSLSTQAHAVTTTRQDEKENADDLERAIASVREVDSLSEETIVAAFNEYAHKENQRTYRAKKISKISVGALASALLIGTGVFTYQTIKIANQREEAAYPQRVEQLVQIAKGTKTGDRCETSMQQQGEAARYFGTDIMPLLNDGNSLLYDNTINGVRFRIVQRAGGVERFFGGGDVYLVANSTENGNTNLLNIQEFDRISERPVNSLDGRLERGIFFNCPSTALLDYSQNAPKTTMVQNGQVVSTTPGVEPYKTNVRTMVKTLQEIIKRNQ